MLDSIDVKGSSGGDLLGKMLYAHFALCGCGASLCGWLNLGGEVEDRFSGRKLGIDERFTGDGIASERVPRRMDVGNDVGSFGRTLCEDRGGDQK